MVRESSPAPEFSWQTHVGRLTEVEFKQRYRLCPLSFDKLLGILEPGLSVQNEKQHLNSRSGQPIQMAVHTADNRPADCGLCL